VLNGVQYECSISHVRERLKLGQASPTDWAWHPNHSIDWEPLSVVLSRFPPPPPKTDRKQSQRAGGVSDEQRHATVLGLAGQVTLADIRRRYLELIKEYHPDRVASLGHKLRELAEAESKKINAAYEYFNGKYGSQRNG
jgi:hypothetical protein